MNPEALDIAAALDRERRDGKARGPLHGIPVLVKDVSASFLLTSFHICCVEQAHKT